MNVAELYSSLSVSVFSCNNYIESSSNLLQTCINSPVEGKCCRVQTQSRILLYMPTLNWLFSVTAFLFITFRSSQSVSLLSWPFAKSALHIFTPCRFLGLKFLSSRLEFGQFILKACDLWSWQFV